MGDGVLETRENARIGDIYARAEIILRGGKCRDHENQQSGQCES